MPLTDCERRTRSCTQKRRTSQHARQVGAFQRSPATLQDQALAGCTGRASGMQQAVVRLVGSCGKDLAVAVGRVVAVVVCVLGLEEQQDPVQQEHKTLLRNPSPLPELNSRWSCSDR